MAYCFCFLATKQQFSASLYLETIFSIPSMFIFCGLLEMRSHFRKICKTVAFSDKLTTTIHCVNIGLSATVDIYLTKCSSSCSFDLKTKKKCIHFLGLLTVMSFKTGSTSWNTFIFPLQSLHWTPCLFFHGGGQGDSHRSQRKATEHWQASSTKNRAGISEIHWHNH